MSAPERIYLQGMGDPLYPVTWCRHQVGPEDVEYVRADLLAPTQAPFQRGDYVRPVTDFDVCLDDARTMEVIMCVPDPEWSRAWWVGVTAPGDDSVGATRLWHASQLEATPAPTATPEPEQGEPMARWIQWVKQPGHYIGPFATQEEAEAYMARPQQNDEEKTP